MKSDQPEKVYVAIGTDWYDGFSTLQWTLRKWSENNNGVRIVILHASDAVCKDYVYTPIGKLPTSSLNEEKLRVLEKTEEANRNKILSQYIAFCDKVETEVIKIETDDHQPLHKQIIEMISSFRITKLVMSLGFMKHSSGKSRASMSGSFYVVRHKPDFCETYVICGGRLVFLRGENEEEGFIEDDRGFTLAKLKEKNHSIRNWLGRMFPENVASVSSDSHSSSFRSNDDSASSPRSNEDSPHQWNKCNREIENYVSGLLSLARDGGELDPASEELFVSENSDVSERIWALRSKIRKAQETIHWNRKQSSAAQERCEKAEWAIGICNIRVGDQESGGFLGMIQTLVGLQKIHALQVFVEMPQRNLSSISHFLNSVHVGCPCCSQDLVLRLSRKTRQRVQVQRCSYSDECLESLCSIV